MSPNERAEFLNDLDATDESRVRRKLLMGSYQGWQLTTAELWLEQQHAERVESRAKSGHFWVAATCVVGLLGLVVTFVVGSLPK